MSAQRMLTLIGTAPTAEEPAPGFNVAPTYMDVADVGADFGEDSDVYEGAQEAFAEVDEIRATVLEAVEYTEVLGDSDTTVTSSGQVANSPMTGTEPVTVTVDGDPAETVDVVSSPPDLTEAEERADDPSGLLAAVNRDTGEVETSQDTSGAGSGIEVTYSDLSWSPALEDLEARDPDVVAMATHRFGYGSIGDLDELVPWLDSGDTLMPIAYPNGQQYDRAETGLDLAIDVGSYAPSRNVVPISNEVSGALESRIGGMYAAHEADYNIYQKEVSGFSVPRASKYARQIGAPETDLTFEGGDGGQGPSNVLVADGGATVMSNSLTTAGINSDYRWADVGQRIAVAEQRARRSVGDLFRRNEHVTFQEGGLIDDAIKRELAPDTGGPRDMYQDVETHIPEREELPISAIGNRIWENIELELVLTGYVHRADMTLRTTLA